MCMCWSVVGNDTFPQSGRPTCYVLVSVCLQGLSCYVLVGCWEWHVSTIRASHSSVCLVLLCVGRLLGMIRFHNQGVPLQGLSCLVMCWSVVGNDTFPQSGRPTPGFVLSCYVLVGWLLGMTRFHNQGVPLQGLSRLVMCWLVVGNDTFPQSGRPTPGFVSSCYVLVGCWEWHVSTIRASPSRVCLVLLCVVWLLGMTRFHNQGVPLQCLSCLVMCWSVVGNDTFPQSGRPPPVFVLLCVGWSVVGNDTFPQSGRPTPGFVLSCYVLVGCWECHVSTIRASHFRVCLVMCWSVVGNDTFPQSGRPPPGFVLSCYVLVGCWEWHVSTIRASHSRVCFVLLCVGWLVVGNDTFPQSGRPPPGFVSSCYVLVGCWEWHVSTIRASHSRVCLVLLCVGWLLGMTRFHNQGVPLQGLSCLVMCWSVVGNDTFPQSGRPTPVFVLSCYVLFGCWECHVSTIRASHSRVCLVMCWSVVGNDTFPQSGRPTPGFVLSCYVLVGWLLGMTRFHNQGVPLPGLFCLVMCWLVGCWEWHVSTIRASPSRVCFVLLCVGRLLGMTRFHNQGVPLPGLFCLVMCWLVGCWEWHVSTIRASHSRVCLVLLCVGQLLGMSRFHNQGLPLQGLSCYVLVGCWEWHVSTIRASPSRVCLVLLCVGRLLGMTRFHNQGVPLQGLSCLVMCWSVVGNDTFPQSGRPTPGFVLSCYVLVGWLLGMTRFHNQGVPLQGLSRLVVCWLVVGNDTFPQSGRPPPGFVLSCYVLVGCWEWHVSTIRASHSSVCLVLLCVGRLLGMSRFHNQGLPLQGLSCYVLVGCWEWHVSTIRAPPSRVCLVLLCVGRLLGMTRFHNQGVPLPGLFCLVMCWLVGCWEWHVSTIRASPSRVCLVLLCVGWLLGMTRFHNQGVPLQGLSRLVVCWLVVGNDTFPQSGRPPPGFVLSCYVLVGCWEWHVSTIRASHSSVCLVLLCVGRLLGMTRFHNQGVPLQGLFCLVMCWLVGCWEWHVSTIRASHSRVCFVLLCVGWLVVGNDTFPQSGRSTPGFVLSCYVLVGWLLGMTRFHNQGVPLQGLFCLVMCWLVGCWEWHVSTIRASHSSVCLVLLCVGCVDIIPRSQCLFFSVSFSWQCLVFIILWNWLNFKHFELHFIYK